MSQKKQAYIPGLNERPDDLQPPPQPIKESEDDILIRDFRREIKNPTMCLHEYCQRHDRNLSFKEEPVDLDSVLFLNGSYGCRAIIDDLAYPIAAGKNKKAAKNAASKLAFKVIIGESNFVPAPLWPELDDNRFIEVRTLTDICEEREIKYVKEMNIDHEKNHVCTIYLAGFAPVKKSSLDKEEAVVAAHAAALKLLGEEIHVNKPVAEVSSQIADRVPNYYLAIEREKTAWAALEEIFATLPPEISGTNHQLSCIFLVNQNFSGIGTIVAIGTGSSVIQVESLTEDGRCLIDSTCLTMAREDLLKGTWLKKLCCAKIVNRPFLRHNRAVPSYM
ncbi:hypothetical protein Btru_074622 [Bulinus truncatus]|nr:hypothetical protein Btru_074622 [Bulinus truncatus]